MFSRSISLEQPIDLNNVCRGDGLLFVKEGVGYAGRHVIAAGNENEVIAILQSITQLSPSSTPPIAFGLVPFHPSEDATFVLPTLQVAELENGSCVATLIGKKEEDVSEDKILEAITFTSDLPPRPSTNSFRVSPRMDVDTYLNTVTLARDFIRAGKFQKVVIARDIEVEAQNPIDVHSVLQRLRASFGSSYRYSVGNMIGASPELLVHVEGRTIRSHPLAGTAPRTGDPDTDATLAQELIESTKNQLEHRLVVDMVRDTLLPHCSFLDWEAEPSIVTVANVQHLGTAVEGALTEPAEPVMSFVRMICPTPALGGYPSETAIAFIDEHEEMERGFYGGAVGVMDSTGNGTFAVAIRCAHLSDDRRIARLFAGGGIVSESDPYSELAETQAKFQAMLSAIVRP
jgi:menaquinone-specific isochorismate synthase